MANDRIKVAGYSQRIFFNDGIEYRNFSDDLVGFQLTSDGGTPLFTMGNFSITTNNDPKASKIFSSNKFSNFVTLATLNTSTSVSVPAVDDNSKMSLNIDRKNLNYYAYFGSLVEFVRVSLETIITNWPASLYVTPALNNPNPYIATTGYTVENYEFDLVTNVSTFKVSTNNLKNKFAINYQTNGSIANTFSSSNSLRNLAVNYESYAILIDGIEYDVLEFTGSTHVNDDYIYLKVDGNPFTPTGVTGNNYSVLYHIKPNALQVEAFFAGLSDFESYLLNRKVVPTYTAVFKYPIRSEDGVMLYATETVTWPVTDGYNIDFDSTQYVAYATKLLTIGTDSDETKTDLVTRFLVSESISSFDTVPTCTGDRIETAGQKMNKTLKIYGREFDEIKKYIDGISLANTVTYNKEDNTPDAVLKNLARVMGWDLVSSVLENDLLKSYLTPNDNTFSGHSVGITPIEAEHELWRRLILNSPWIWKSKGTRKVIEFLFKFIGAPNGLVQFNEYIYKTNAPIDVELFKQILELNNIEDTDLANYNLDYDGYPKVLANTPQMYFQKGGLWYRETGGANADVDILMGNNPHVGPYDGGYEYINQFNELIPNFSAVTITSSTITTDTTPLFLNYNLGLINNCDGPAYKMPEVSVVDEDDMDLSGCYVVTTEIIDDPHPVPEVNDCGCETDDCDQSLQICIQKQNTILDPKYYCDGLVRTDTRPNEGIYLGVYTQQNIDGTQYGSFRTSPYFHPECCSVFGGEPHLYTQYQNGDVASEGYICCMVPSTCGCIMSWDWTMVSSSIYDMAVIDGDRYLTFYDGGGNQRVVSVDGANCLNSYTTAMEVTDPFTGEDGYGCKITTLGASDMSQPVGMQYMFNVYASRADGSIGNCDQPALGNGGTEPVALPSNILQ